MQPGLLAQILTCQSSIGVRKANIEFQGPDQKIAAGKL